MLNDHVIGVDLDEHLQGCGRANGERMAREVGLVTGVYARS